MEFICSFVKKLFTSYTSIHKWRKVASKHGSCCIFYKYFGASGRKHGQCGYFNSDRTKIGKAFFLIVLKKIEFLLKKVFLIFIKGH